MVRCTMVRCTMGRLSGMLFGLALALGVWGQCPPAEAAAEAVKAARPTVEISPTGCITPECHANIKAYKVTHGPVGAGTCNACHRLTDAKAHTFELARQKAELCTFCHEFSTGQMPVVHKPVMTGECLGCHNPHGGTDHGLTREATTAQLCVRCHENVAYGKKFLHHPVENGECTACHRPHASKYPKLLDAVGANLCLSCHRDFAAQMAKAKFTHKALEEGCTKCHDAHGSAYPKGMRQTLPELCLSCHKSIKDKMTAKYKHPAILGERACLTCHTAHGGDLARLMCDLPVRVCMTCHDKRIEMKEGGVLTAMTEITDPTTVKHTPIRNGQCDGCHSTHGGDKPLLLRKEYSTKISEPFSAEKYDLCFSCHDKRLADSQQSGGLTNFRNGDLNLHYVHLAKRELGENCRVCHGTHTGKFERLIRDSAQYGQWRMALKFEKTVTGGTCNTGCHPQYSYDRKNPVASKTAVLTAQAPKRVPEANTQEAIVVKRTARDILGNGVKVPADGQPSVLLFLRAEQPQSLQVVTMVSAAMPRITPAQVVVVFGGPQAKEQAKTFAGTKNGSWPVIADDGFALSSELGVDVWPATLVVQADGVLVSHIGGAPPSLTMELEAYLELATKKINREALQQRLTKFELVGDHPAKRASWYLQMGAKLLDEGKAEEARAMFADGMKAQPDSVELRVAMVRTLAELKQT